MRRHLIVNADDLGASAGVNRGIAEAHQRGIVTSASLMVERHAAAQAAEMARANPGLSLGLHIEADELDPSDSVGVDAALERQLARFRELVGRDPTHVDSHHHVHRQPQLRPACAGLAAGLGVPLRESSPVVYLGGFFARSERGVTDLHRVSFEILERTLRHEVTVGWSELGCHPGYVTGDFASSYLNEREYELSTLTDPRLPGLLEELQIELRSFSDYLTEVSRRSRTS